MSTGMHPACYVCHLRRNVETALKLGSPETAAAFAKEVMGLYLDAPEGVSAPWFGPGITALYGKYYGLDPDRYRAEKEASNRFVMERMDAITARVEGARDPVFAGLQSAILGNYLDFAALQGEVSFDRLDAMLEQALQLELDARTYERLCQDLAAAGKLLYLTDNAGEIGFDRVFARQLQKKYPDLAITFCVRGGPAANDATREDAAAVGLEFPVIDNGNTVAGTQLELLGPAAKKALEEADVIIAKGQGNAETLLGCGKNIYYAFLVKCQRFMELFGKEKMTPMLVSEKHKILSDSQAESGI